MMMFFFVLGTWLYSARPSLYNFGHWIAPNRIPDWYTYQISQGERSGQVDPVANLEEAEPTLPVVDLSNLIITPDPVEIEVIQPDPIVIQVATATPVAEAGPVFNYETGTGNISPFMKKASQFCGNCDGYSVQIRYTHYWPPEGGTNCWDWNEATQYCDSPTFSGIPWESAEGWGAACPYDWGIGTWVEVPYWGSVMCLDRGDMVCVQGSDGWLCEVDILAPSIGAIDGQILNSEVYIP